MLQSRGHADLALEPLRTEHLPQLRMQDLEGDGAIVLQVVREIDSGHPPAPELALERVSAAQPALKLCQQVGHWAWERSRGWKSTPL